MVCWLQRLRRQLLPLSTVKFVRTAGVDYPTAIHRADQAMQREEQDVLHSTEEQLQLVTERWTALQAQIDSNPGLKPSSRFKRLLNVAAVGVKKADR